MSRKKSHLIGLTGGIASGKSTVSRYLQEQGYPVIDADALVHALQAPGGRLFLVLQEHFGEAILTPEGELDRHRLADKLFQDATAMAWSQKVQGAIIREELAKARDQALKHHAVVFMDIPLLIEQDYVTWFDAIWLVSLSEEKQLTRLLARNPLTKEQAKARIASQMPLAEKRAYASLVIDNNGSKKATLAQVKKALKTLK
ncbi:dephospho-CoA kinase [Streptococcus sp. DD12]|uniref:dephospho-CoA kinase n=1 Tax=Streptococcus sp. DD12 TaxID=1777880 RepID=UPI000792B3B9|nr:dephospho-CoA kinase [Streptococcus sp. DD12]KXT76014.1 Dephospho-CoA kinase [Streptococcus sp. DD12]